MLSLVFAAGESPALHCGRAVQEWLDNCGDVVARGFTSPGSSWITWRDLGVFAFSRESTEVRVWPDPGVLHGVVTDVFSVLQPVILQVLGFETLHASAALGRDSVVAFCGRSGSGKSTLSLAMQQRAWRQFADDSLVIRLDRGRVIACPVPFSPRLRPSSQAHFVRSGVSSPSCSESALSEHPLRAIFLLRQDGGLEQPRISLVPQSSAFKELLKHAHCFNAEDPISARTLAESYLAFVERVPVMRLEYRPKLEQLNDLIDAVESAVAAVCDRGSLRVSPALGFQQ